MKIRAGYELSYESPKPTPMILQLSVHPSRIPDLLSWDRMRFDPPTPAVTYHDSFGNFCHVITAPKGRLNISTDFVVQDKGEQDVIVPQAEQHALKDLPVEVLIYLLGSRYCETDRLSNTAWSLFGHLPQGWPLVQAICDYVHDRITFGYQHANASLSAWEAYNVRRGVCRDFAAWFEAYLGGRWYTFDPRNNVPRIGRILMARGRDATDVAIVTSFGPCTLAGFKVMTDEITSNAPAST